MEKTIIQHLTDAMIEGYPWAKQAIINCLNDPMDTAMETVATTKSKALHTAFYWLESPEGHTFWDEIYIELRKAENEKVVAE